MPALSKKQQKFMGIVRSIQKGEQPASKFSKDAQDVAKDMKKSSVKKFAGTKHKGLPSKVRKEYILNKLRKTIREELEDYRYGSGDIVKDVNPTCPHYGAMGKVKSVNPRSVVFVVMNKGKNFKPGMELEKSHDQMKKMNENKVYKVGDTVSLLSFDRRHRGRAKVKGVTKSRPNKFGIKNHYVTNKGTFTDMEVEGTEAFKLRFKGDTEKKVTKAMNSPYGVVLPEQSVRLNEMNYKQFVKYMNDFYGPKGIYPDKKKRTLGQKDINMAYSTLLKQKPNFEIGFDSTDREMLRDILIKMKKLDPDYSKKESVNEFSMKLQKSTQDMVDALLKVKSPMPKEIESALIMMAKGYGLDYVKKEVKKDAKGFYKNLKQMAAAFPEFRNKPKDYKFESVIQERNDEVQTGKDYTKLWLQSINLIIKQANNLKGALAKHPVKRDLNKLKAVENLFKKFIKPAIEKERASSRHYAPNQTELKKYLSNSKFKVAVRILKQTLQSSNGYNENSWYDLDDRTTKLIEKMSKVLYDIETKMDKANLENVNESINEDGHTDVASSKRKVMIMVDDSNKLLNKLNGMNKEDSLPSWWSDKITLSQNYLQKATNYLLNPVESVNENLRPSDKKILMVIATEMVKTNMKGKNKNQIRKELPDILSTMGTNDLSKKSPTNRFNKNKMISLGKGFGKLSDSDKKVFINTLMYNVGLAKSINEKKKMFPPDKMTPKQAKEYKKFIDYAKMGIEYKIDMSLFESINESKEPEVITQLRDIVKRQTNKKIKDPKTKKTMRVDMFTASAITQVYDAVKKTSHKSKFESLPLDKMAQLSFKMMK